MSDLDHFKATYFQECSELLMDLEEQFLAIEQGDRDPETLHAVFRAVHSIKGGAGAFGFDQLVGFAHAFETMLDLLRSDKLELSAEIVALCLRGADVLADLVNAAQTDEALEDGFGEDLKTRFVSLTGGGETDELESLADVPVIEEFDDLDFTPVRVDLDALHDDDSESDDATEVDDGLDDLASLMGPTDSDGPDGLDGARAERSNGWRIAFTPHRTLFERANEPLLLFRELETLGKLTIEAHPQTAPELTDFDAHTPLIGWTLTLEGEAARTDIEAVFEFVEGDCDLKIQPRGALAADTAPVGMAEDDPPSPVAKADEPEVGGMALSLADLAADLDDVEDLAAGATKVGEPDPLAEDQCADDPASASARGLGEESVSVVEPPVVSEGKAEPVADDAPAVPKASVKGDLASLMDLLETEAPAIAAQGGDAVGGDTAQAVAKPTKAESTEDDAKAAKPGGKSAAKPAAVASIRVDLEKVDRVMNMVGELVITQAMLTQQVDDHLRERYSELVRGLEILAQNTRSLQDSVMAIRAQPVKSVFQRMPRLVRELAAKTDKKIRLEMIGEATEIDKTVIEQLSDPLTHMIRNSIDHGVELPEVRIANGKHAEGVVRLSAAQAGGKILIAIEDDGAGINRERVLQKAIDRGIVDPEQSLSDEAIDDLVFAPGFSTAEAVSDISGRGVGMDVVRQNIKRLGGRVSIRSTPGKGCRITLTLPLTLAVLDVMQVAVAGSPFVVPLGSIIESMQFSLANFGSLPNGQRVLKVRGTFVPVIELTHLFGFEKVKEADSSFVILCEAEGGGYVALMVDQIIGQQQVVIKSLEENFERLEGIAGGTILGDGRVALILDVSGLRQLAGRPPRAEAA